MTKRSTAGLATMALFFGSLACASGVAREDDTAAAPQDTTEAAEPPPGYSGMEQDTTGTEQQPTAVDTFLNEQGTGVPADTAGYGGLEQPDTSGAAAGDTSTGMDTTSTTGGFDTTGMTSPDTTGMTGADTSGTSGWSDTTGTSSMDTTGQQ
jgi:hypothetical protein